MRGKQDISEAGYFEKLVNFWRRNLYISVKILFESDACSAKPFQQILIVNFEKSPKETTSEMLQAGNLKHFRKDEIRNFPRQSNHGGLPKISLWQIYLTLTLFLRKMIQCDLLMIKVEGVANTVFQHL